MSNIGQHLRSIRQDKHRKQPGGHFTLNAVAKRAAVSHSYLSQIETGKIANPSPDILRKLSEALKEPYVRMLEVAGYLPDQVSPELRMLASLTPDILEALNDPLARKGMVAIYNTKKTTEPLVSEILEIISQMDPEKIKALIKLCDP